MSHDFDSDISLRHVILKIQDYALACFKGWKLILLLALLMGLFVFILKKDAPNMYKAELTFMLNEDESGGLAGLSGVLGSFGIGLGSSESNLDKILELAKARRVTQNAIFSEVTIGGKKDFLANHYIQMLKDHDEWTLDGGLFSAVEDSMILESFSFSHDSISLFSIKENKALKKVHGSIAGNEKEVGKLNCYYNELTGIMALIVECNNEELAVKLTNAIFNKLSEFYIEKSVEKQSYDLKIIKSKYDSISYALSNVEYKLASFEDSNQGLFRKKDLLTKSRLSTEKQKLQFMIGKAEEQLQIAQITLDNRTPYIQVVDRPLLPLTPQNNTPLFFFIFGFIFGGFLAVGYIVIKKLYKEVMTNNE